MTQHVKLGQVVHYVSKTGEYECAAVVTATKDSLFQPNVDAGHLPMLSSEDHVHLTVLTPGKPGHVSAATRESMPSLADPDRPNKPMGSTYAEWNIPYEDPMHMEAAGTWHWPQHCAKGL